MNVRMIFDFIRDRIHGQEAEDEETFPGMAMARWAGQMTIGPAGLNNRGQLHSPVRSLSHLVGTRGVVACWLDQLG
eukprot:8819629-Pyramimonas_sp.AAC.1